MSYVLRRISFRPRAGRIRLGGFPCRQLRIFAYVAAADAPRRVLDDFFALLLQRRTWDVAQIFDLPVTNPLAEYVMERSLLGDRCSVVGRTFETYQVGIAESFDIYLRDNFTKKTRYNLKREVRLFQEATGGEATFTPYSSADRAREFLEGAEHALKRSHRWRDRPYIGPTPIWLRKIAHLADRGQFRGYLLSVGDTPIAFCHGEMRWGELSIEIAGHDEQFARLNPGKVLLYRMLEELHASQAARRLNLGTTTAEHRRVFAASSRCMVDVTAYPYGAYPQVLRALAGAADAGYRGLRTVARKWMPYIKRRARAASPFALAGALDIPGLLLQ
jgi:CelD/BcsL family acetyltransferase involved in cellulose biosynthesis